MAASVVHPSPVRDAGQSPRLTVAYAASLAIHLLLAQALAPEILPRDASSAGFQVITVRIEHESRPEGLGPVELRNTPVEPPLLQAGATADAAAAAFRESGAEDTPVSVPRIPDPTVYAARDLDSYPRPAAPLDIGRFGQAQGSGAVTVQFELTIDERGVVNDVATARSDVAAAVETDLRALLTATRFIPALKDGRAVKSRVLLSIDLAAQGAGHEH